MEDLVAKYGDIATTLLHSIDLEELESFLQNRRFVGCYKGTADFVDTHIGSVVPSNILQFFDYNRYVAYLVSLGFTFAHSKNSDSMYVFYPELMLPDTLELLHPFLG